MVLPEKARSVPEPSEMLLHSRACSGFFRELGKPFTVLPEKARSVPEPSDMLLRSRACPGMHAVGHQRV